VERIGVFHHYEPAEIVSAVEYGGLTGVQLHGSFDPSLAERLRKRLGDSFPIIQTLHWAAAGTGNDPAQVARDLAEIALGGVVDRVLVDSKVGTALGGTGIAFDWSAARETLRSNLGMLKLIVAGGLRPENVTVAIGRLEPWGVDVVTGVEAEPGRKSPEKLRAFIKNVRVVEKGSA